MRVLVWTLLRVVVGQLRLVCVQRAAACVCVSLWLSCLRV